MAPRRAVTKPTYQAASVRLAAPFVEVGAAPLPLPVLLEVAVVMANVVKEDAPVVVVMVLERTVPVEVMPVPVLVLVVPFLVVVAGWELEEGAPEEVLMVLSGTLELVGLERIGKDELLA